MLHVVNDSLKAVERILEVHRNPRLAEDVDHEYGDKYRLVDQLTNTALIAQLNELVHFGVTDEVLGSIDKTKPATLRFQASDSCKFLKQQEIEVPAPRSEETDEYTQTSGTFFGTKTKSTVKQVVNHIREFHWKVEVKWEISLYAGSKVAERNVLVDRSSSMVLITQSNRAPLPEHRECKPVDVSLTWMLNQIDVGSMASKFRVDTQDPDTKTPRRNGQVEEALRFMEDLALWMNGLRAYFDQCVQHDILDRHNPAKSTAAHDQRDCLSALSSDGMFMPVQALMEEKDGGDDESSDPVLSADDMDKFLKEQIRSINEHLEKLQKEYPGRQMNKLVTVTEATVVLLSLHSSWISHQFRRGVDYAEDMLRHQLTAAIGKQIQQSDVDKFMQYHNARLLRPAPKPFCHAIRQPGHYPCGLLSIEAMGAGEQKRDPIETLVREVDSTAPVELSVDAATTVQLTGQKYLHGWVQQRFGHHRPNYGLIARARQFSSFLLVVGTMAGPDKLDPKDAIIVQDKDELVIPLLLEEIPTAKEFKDAIRSLSPEQQRFAEAFRSMQLGSSVMGICIIQIKPQLEALLGLPHDALIKEMKLTRELTELFVEYQVPSDLLSYDGIQDNASRTEKIDNVRGHVKDVLDVIEEAKKQQLEEQKMRTDMAYEAATEDEPTVAMASPAYDQEMMDQLLVKKRTIKKSAQPRALASDAMPDASASAMLRSGPAPRSTRSSAASQFGASSPGPASSTVEGQSSLSSPAFGSTQNRDSTAAEVSSAGDGSVDFTALPQLLNGKIEEHAGGEALRSTNVKLSDRWARNRQENLLSRPVKSRLSPDGIKTEKSKAFDLLDALSRSGSLSIAFSELHVIISVTHCFDKGIIDTIIQDNINPIEKLEMSTLLVGSAIHGKPASMLVRCESDLERLKGFFPKLLTVDDADR